MDHEQEIRDGRELFLAFEDFRWLKRAPVDAILRLERPPPGIRGAMEDDLRGKLPDELVDELLAGASSEEELVGPGGLVSQLTKRLVERAKHASERNRCAPAVRPMITAAVTVPIERCSSSCGACAWIRAGAAVPTPCGIHIDGRLRLAGAKLSRTAALDARSSTVLTAAPSSGTSTCGAMSPGKSLVRGSLLVQVRSSREWLYQTRTPSLVPSST